MDRIEKKFRAMAERAPAHFTNLISLVIAHPRKKSNFFVRCRNFLLLLLFLFTSDGIPVGVSAGHASGDTNASIDLKTQRPECVGEGKIHRCIGCASDMRNKTSALFRSRNATRRTNDANESWKPFPSRRARVACRARTLVSRMVIGDGISQGGIVEVVFHSSYSNTLSIAVSIVKTCK